jgi:hypothetical protein
MPYAGKLRLSGVGSAVFCVLLLDPHSSLLSKLLKTNAHQSIHLTL